MVTSATQADFAYIRRQISRVLHEETSVPKLHMATPASETLANSTLLRCCNCLVMKSCKQGTLGIREAPHRHLRRSSEIVDRQHFLRMRNETIWVFRTRNGGYMAMMINHGSLVYPCTPCSGKNMSVHSSTYALLGERASHIHSNCSKLHVGLSRCLSEKELPKMDGTPNHSKLDHFSIGNPWFGDPPI